MLQMKLAGSTIEACEDLAEVWFGDDASEFSRSYIVRNALSRVFPKRKEIEWKEVYFYAEANYGDSPAGKQTALELSDEEIENLSVMQDEFVKIFGTKRIYKPFVVKMIVMSELFHHAMKEVEVLKNKEDFEADNLIVKISTLNVHSAGATNSDSDWQFFEETLNRNDIAALQEVIPGERCSWLHRCEQMFDNKYLVITPLAWKSNNTNWMIATTLIRRDILKDYEPLTINDEKDTLSARYTYGTVTLKNGNKFRLMNLYMPQLCEKDPERIDKASKFWDSILKEIDSIPLDEKLILLGDLNAGIDPKFANQKNFIRLCKKMCMLDSTGNYNTWFNGENRSRLDYIFISGNLATDCIAVTNINTDLLEIDLSDHVMLEAALIKQESFKEMSREALGLNPPDFRMIRYN